jgi:hypothetical protein
VTVSCMQNKRLNTQNKTIEFEATAAGAGVRQNFIYL